ncbi:hypothetical protein V2J09_021764 [Rumex salicifolius]
MFLDGLIHRKLAAILRPWLVDEPQWEVKLGFMRSLVVARNVCFDASAFDLGSHLVLKDIKVEELSVRFHPWSGTAFDVEVRGVHVTISTKESVAEPSDTSVEEKKKILSRIDPEGSALHGNLEKLLNSISSKSGIKSSLLNLILTKCYLCIHDVHIRIEFPFFDEACAFLWNAVELKAQCQSLNNRSLVVGFILSCILPLRESSFEIAASGMDVLVSRKEDVRCLFSSKEPCIGIYLKGLCLLDFMLRAPEVNLAVSPYELSLLAAFSTLISVEPDIRNGQQLWELARKRVYTSILPRRYLLYQVIDIAVKSLQLVKAYQHLLVLIGCRVDKTLQRMVIGLSRGRNFPQSAMEEWTLISEIEEDLHAEAIAWARRVARSRVMSESRVAEESITASGSSPLLHFKYILLLLMVAWRTISKPFGFLLNIFYQKNSSHTIFKGQLLREASTHLLSSTFHLSKISVVVSPTDAIKHSASYKAKQEHRISCMDLLSFCLIVREVVYECEDSIFQQCVSFSMGKLEVASASNFCGISSASTSGKASNSIEDPHRGAVEMKTIIWAEPAESCIHPGKREANSDLCTDSAATIVLDKLFGELQLKWKQLSTRFEQDDLLYSRNPFVICEITSFWLIPALKSPDLGLWKCCLGVGKLNISLGCSEILSITVITRQMLWHFGMADRFSKSVTHAHSSLTFQHIQETNDHSRPKFYFRDMKMALCKLLPDRPVELAAVIAGPRVHLSVRTEEHLVNKYSYDVIVDVNSSELAVWPVTDSGHRRLDDMGVESFMRDGYSDNALPEPDSIDTFVCHENISLGYHLIFGGLKGDLVDPDENQQMQIFLLKPVAVTLSSQRDYLHSFGETIVASSAILSGLIKGGIVFLCIEELYVFLQVFDGLFSQLKIYTVEDYDFNDDKDRVAFIKPEVAGQSSEIEEITMQYCYNIALALVSTFVFTCTLEVDPFDIIFHGSIKGHDTDSETRSGDFRNKNMSLIKYPEFGIWLSTYKMLGEVSCLEDKLEFHADFSGFRAAIFKFKIQIQNMFDQLDPESGFLQFMDCLHEISLSGCTSAFLLDCLEETSSSEITEIADNGVASRATTNYLLLKVTFNDFFVGISSIKDLFSDTYQPDTMLLYTVKKDYKTVCLKVQDVLIRIDPRTLAAFTCCIKSYLQCIRSLFSVGLFSGIEKRLEPSELMSNGHQIEGTDENSSNADNLFSSKDAEDFTINLSQFSIILLSSNNSGEVQEIIGIVDLCFNLRPKIKRKVSLSLYQLKIHSQIRKVNMDPEVKKNGSQLADNDSSERLQNTERKNPVSADASCSSSVSAKKSAESDSVCCVVRETYGNHILKGLSAIVSAEKLEIRDDNNCLISGQGWAGSGSASGLDITISLLEIKVFMDCIESLSEVFTKDASSSVTERLLPSANMEPEKNAEGSFLDGAIVAIQDVHQHMYVTVQHEENKFYLGGTNHYSLVGEKALFRVRIHKQRRWSFQTSWLSLVSLYAKNDEGEPLLLSSSSKSGVVDISTAKNSNDAFWKVVSCKAEHHDGNTYLEPYYHLSQNTFYLVNKRNSCGVAFVDGVPELVSKPGNPFKFKIFCTSSSASGLVRLDNPPAGVDGSNLEGLESRNPYEQAVVIPRIIFAVDNISLTIVDELSDSEDKFPLVKGCLDSVEVAIQILPYKTRVMSTLIATLSYFDAFKIQWRNLVHPCQTYIFYRRRFFSQDALTYHRVPVLFYIGMNSMDVSLTELSLDILLYAVGKLNLAGPFAVNSSAIMANCCKVGNYLGVNLLCQFNDSQDSRVGSNQSAVIFIREIVNQPSTGSYVSLKLETQGTLSTSSIQLPLSELQTCAWRTRIVSLQDVGTYPGPFLVVDILKNVKDGLSVMISPLLRIHNETKFSLELSFERPQQEESESVSLFLKSKDTFDDCIAAFEAVNLSGGAKKALMSLSVGNFLFSFRPDESKEALSNSNKSISVGWSDKIQGGKGIRLSGIIDKLGYKVRKAFNAQSSKCSFSLASCPVTSGDSHLATMHFLVQSIVRDVPVMKPNIGAESSSVVTFLKQKEFFLLPTVRIYNLLQLDVHVLLIGSDKSKQSEGIENQTTVPCGSTAELYANPAVMCFTISLVAFDSSCKPVKSGDWIKKLNKQKDGIQFLDIDLEFHGGKYFALLRLTRDDRGILEAVIYTQYTLKNDTGFPLFCSVLNQKPMSRDEIQSFGNITPPHLGSILPPQSSRSWFMKSNKLCVTLLDEETSPVILDLDSLSGLTEISLVKRLKLSHLLKLGVSLQPLGNTTSAPAEIVSLIPRYIVSNNSNKKIFVRQCDYEDDLEGMTSINSKQKEVLLLVDVPSQRRKVGIFDKLLWKHRADTDDSSLLIQFRMDSTVFGWSGPVCVASLGRFFLKFKASSESLVDQDNTSKQIDYSSCDFAAVNVVEEASSLVIHFSKLRAADLPYRIVNHLSFASVTYYQKEIFESESLPPSTSAYYVWDDNTHPHKLVVRVNGYNISREISLDKVRPWKPFSRSWPQKELANPFRSSRPESNEIDVGKIGYELYADGPTRVLRLSYSQDGPKKGVTVAQLHMRVQLRFSGLNVQLLEQRKQDLLKENDPVDLSVDSPIIMGRLENICLDSLFSDHQKYHQISVRSINLDAKWSAAPFASLLNGHQLSPDSEGNILFILIVLHPSVSNVTQVKYSSILLQPVTINLDEETLLKIVPFWRKSLSQSTQSRQYYFDHFEIHPIKIIASFLPEDSYSSYNSGQEALRTLLHSVIKIPTVKNSVVELNGVLVTHALVTTSELLIRCAQHYSWYAMRAIYIAKGSPLLPPSFTSVFDDLASSSLDVFFDPSTSLLNVRGLTMGTFKLMSKYIKGRGFSGTKRYFGDLGKTLRNAGSNVLFTAVTEISDSVLKGAEGSGFNGMVIGFHQGILKLAMEPTLLGTALLEGGPDRKIDLDQSPGIDLLYIEGYLQAMLDTTYKQEYLRVKVSDNEVVLKNLPPSSSLINEIMDRVTDFLVSRALLKGDSSTRTHPRRHLRGGNEWRIGPTVLTLCEHLFVSFTIRMLRKQTGKAYAKIRPTGGIVGDSEDNEGSIFWRWGFGKFIMSAILAYIDGRLCRYITHPIVRRIVSGFLLTFLDKRENAD